MTTLVDWRRTIRSQAEVLYQVGGICQEVATAELVDVVDSCPMAFSLRLSMTYQTSGWS